MKPKLSKLVAIERGHSGFLFLTPRFDPTPSGGGGPPQGAGGAEKTETP
jgi:hypothetical protein